MNYHSSDHGCFLVANRLALNEYQSITLKRENNIATVNKLTAFLPLNGISDKNYHDMPDLHTDFSLSDDVSEDAAGIAHPYNSLFFALNEHLLDS